MILLLNAASAMLCVIGGFHYLAKTFRRRLSMPDRAVYLVTAIGLCAVGAVAFGVIDGVMDA